MTYHIITYGCQMNEADSDLMAALLEEAGWAAAPGEEADLVILNTCSVREKPEHKVYSRLGELRLLKERNGGPLIAVAGCMAQREGKRLLERARCVDLVVGTRSFHRLPELAARARAGERPIIDLEDEDDPSTARCRPAMGEHMARLRAFVPIIRCCTNLCTYCVVPHVRGRETSRPLEDVLSEVSGLASHGTREVTLLGQNVLAWGRDLASEAGFADLLGEVASLEGLWRVRFLTCHPRDVSDEVISAMRSAPRVCEHIHLPIQAGADRLLAAMNRRYTVAQYRGALGRLRDAVPGLAVTTDIMVGYPGETEAGFEESLDVYRSIGFDGAFMFAYSARPGTPAAEAPDQVPRKTRLARLHRLIAMQNQITVDRNAAEVGSTVEVLVEGAAERGAGLLEGRTRSNKHVVFPGDPGLAGTLTDVTLVEAHLWGFMGKIAARRQDG